MDAILAEGIVMNIAMLLEMAAEGFPDRTAITSGSEHLSYAALLAQAHAAGTLIRNAGAACIYLDVSGPAGPPAMFGAAYAELPYVPLNYRLTKPELDALLERVGGGLLVAGQRYHDLVELPAKVRAMTTPEFLATLHTMSPADEPAPPIPDAIAIQLFTSGTTGEPKAAILRHENVLSYIFGTLDFASAGEDEATLVSVPPYHIAGISAILSSIYVGRRIVLLPDFDPAEWLRLAREERVTNAFLVPTMLSRIIDHAGGEALDLPDLRAIAYGGGKMPLATIARAMDLLPHVDFTNAYGLTETSSTICLLGPDDHRTARSSADAHIHRRLSSVGRPIPMIELQVRAEDGSIVGAQEAGLIFARGPQVSGEYLALGSQLDPEGWFPTRDRGFLDEDGFLFLDGRADDVIIRGGENISPGEIEEVLLAHPAVRDVAVVAVADETWGEAIAAAIVLHPGMSPEPSSLQQLVRDQLRSSRIPQHVRFVDELPYNELGKLLRRVVRERFESDASGPGD
jgi:long-chain acyl-CoA synthetase